VRANERFFSSFFHILISFWRSFLGFVVVVAAAVAVLP
jgi:hypothetical protein